MIFRSAKPFRMRFTALLFLTMTGLIHPLNAETPGILDQVETGQKLVALTFDDGPDAQTLELMKLIEAEGGKATFFIVGKNIPKEAEVLRASARAGHEIGNHSFTHASLPKLSPEEMRTEIADTQRLIGKITGQQPVLFRAPFLDYDDQLHRILREEQLQAVNANLSTQDWDAATTVEQIVQRATADLVPGSIILMHSWPENTLAAMPEILRILREKGYRMVTVSQLLKAGRP